MPFLSRPAALSQSQSRCLVSRLNSVTWGKDFLPERLLSRLSAHDLDARWRGELEALVRDFDILFLLAKTVLDLAPISPFYYDADNTPLRCNL